jgi:hypothetical protein
MRKIVLMLTVLLSLPILLHVYQPAWQLGGLGLVLGAIGISVSPLFLFGALAYMIVRSGARDGSCPHRR